ncbi:hypothetical protein [Clostridium tarantellae]|uniref:Uncharacterized protein n=1 Tax=Clostridium tarantellae TaxID=39493 RepID=A0A6I1MVZ8_9CLOT|nr:hypothetical protein [Clostridium tarantellae]MPQ44349.1 hypothetical protein [Clostridium tarantellae]
MSIEEIKGKNILNIIIAIIIFSYLLDFTIGYFLSWNQSFYFWSIKFLMGCIVCYYINLGRKWAVKLTRYSLALLSLLCFVGLFSIFIEFESAIVSLIFFIIYSFAFYLLALNKNVRMFLEF